MYNRYAESGRIEWVQKYARYIDPANAKTWSELMVPTGDGLILRKITTDFKFVRSTFLQLSAYMVRVLIRSAAHEIPRPHQRVP